MRIEIWADVVCPWCYIGKKRFERALAGFDGRSEVEVVQRSFELDPSAPRNPTETVAAMLGRRYGGGEDAGRQMMSQVQQVAAEEGLDFTRHSEGLHLNSHDAHRLLAGSAERRSALTDALMDAYFVHAENLADHDVLIRLAVSVGMSDGDARAALASGAGEEVVADDLDDAAELGITGVPFFVIDRHLGVSGAQPLEVFAQALERGAAGG